MSGQMRDAAARNAEYQRYLSLFFALQLAQWENYAGAKHDLNQLDAQIYSLLLQGEQKRDCSHREEAVWQQIRRRGLVDRHPQVARLRNRLDDWDNYSPVSEDRHERDPIKRRINLAAAMRQDVLELMQLRNQLAKEQGTASYPKLAMWSEDLDLSAVKSLVGAYLESHLDEARQIISANAISWSSWFQDMRRLGQLTLSGDAHELMAELSQRLGLDELHPQISLTVRPDGLAGYTGVICPGSDVRMLIRPVQSLSSLQTLCHEFGHALCHALNRAEGLFQTWTGSYDETMAVLVEQIGLKLLLTADAVEQARQLAVLENTRCAISFLYELDLWQQPEQAERLYLEHYGQLGLDLGDPVIWALDSFRSIDPMYVQNYVLGAIFAEQIQRRWLDAHGNDFQAIGQELCQLFASGRRFTLLEKAGLHTPAVPPCHPS